MTLPKAALVLVWLFCVGCFFVNTDTTLALVGRITFWGMLGIHLIEFLAFRTLMQGSANGLVGNFASTPGLANSTLAFREHRAHLVSDVALKLGSLTSALASRH